MANQRPLRNKPNNRTATLAVVVLLALIGIVGFLLWMLLPSASAPPSLTEGEEEYLSASPAQHGPLAGLEIERNTLHDEQEFHYLLNGTPHFDRKGEKGSVYLENCEGNTGYMQVVYRLENGEEVYASPLLPSNWSVATDALKVPLESGEYKAKALIYAYCSAEADEYIECFEENIVITVG
ncbi:MAG: hypothetical protein IKU72_05960 [Oscillospiraceae bacterium]|nr:hypothetical protein [Oscillospiraceae bacterium]